LLSYASGPELALIERLVCPPPLERLASDPALILADAGKKPDPWQAELLRGSDDNAILCCSRQAGKSSVAAALALKYALLRPDSLVLLLSPTLRQSSELFKDKVQRLYQALGRPVAVSQESALQMALANGSRVVSLPGDEGTIRGYSGVRLLVIDEAARVPDDLYRAVRPMLAVSGGRLVVMSTPYGQRGWFYREWHAETPWNRVRVTAEQCPRISPEFLAEERRALGEDWFRQEYLVEFVQGGGDPLFPGDWLDRAARLADSLKGRPRKAKAIGIDPGEGQASTVWAVVDELGLIKLVSLKTPDTAEVTSRTLQVMREFGVPAAMVLFDRGGGGKQHADRLRAQGHAVRAVGFGEAVAVDARLSREKTGQRDAKAYYTNRRSQLYGELRELLDPAAAGFAIPAEYAELRRQLAPVPLWRDPEGRLFLPPKNRKGGDEGGPKVTMNSLIGCSPDESDALCLACHAMLHPQSRLKAGALR
jgi:hypothetical protein